MKTLIRSTLMMTLASLLALSACDQRKNENRFQKDPAQIGEAFVAAFGQPAPAILSLSDHPPNSLDPDTSNGPFQFTPDALFELSSNLWVLISDGKWEMGGHYSKGRLAIHYLTLENGQYKVLGQWLNMGGGAESGDVAEWTIRYNLEANPVIWTTATGGGMGCNYTWHDMISLLPNIARLSVDGLITEESYSPNDYEAKTNAWKIEGIVAPLKDQKSFDVIYKGKINRTEHYELSGDRYYLKNYDEPLGGEGC